MERASRQHWGFTLMEATVALAVFTVGMLGLAGTYSQIVSANAASVQKQTAVLLAERKMAQLRMTNAAEFTRTRGTFAAPFDGYTWEVHVRSRAQDLNLADVWVEVRFRSGKGVRLWSQMVVSDGR
jgi:type II secretion system protein I